MARLKVMADSYAIVYSLLDGYARRAIERWIKGDFEMLISNETLEEVRAFLSRGEVPDALAEDFIEFFRNEAEVVTEESSALSGSYRILEAAISGSADYILSEDQRLLRLEAFKLIEVLSSKDLIERLK